MKFLYIFCVLCMFSKLQFTYGDDEEEVIPTETEEPNVESNESNRGFTFSMEPDYSDEQDEVEEKPRENQKQKKTPFMLVNARLFLPFLVPPYTSTILGPADVPFGLILGPYIRRSLALTEERPNGDTTDLNLEIIEKKYNHNYENSAHLLEHLRKHFPKADNYFKISKEGFTCDDKFCREFGHGRHAFGICSPFFCQCSKMGGTEGMKCAKGLVFDPIYQNCDSPITVKICGY